MDHEIDLSQVSSVSEHPTHDPAHDPTIDLGSDDALEELEREICRLPDVSASRIVADTAGRPIEVHILARAGKPAKQVVRDVQSVALASFGIHLDRRIVSVVQLGENGTAAVVTPTPTPTGRRPIVGAVTSEVTGLRNLVRIMLTVGDRECIGFSEGSVASTARHRLVAHATLDALRQLEPRAECLDVDSASVVRLGPEDVAIVTVVFVQPPSEQLVSGSAIVRGHDEGDAVARAVLDATNRRLPALT